ncbi:hypothetical protein OXT66_01420 [Lentilactobacillus senioris]|uniref:hypothetical protein n=1 Tax=Lentilactobacillus senioris TaxID=931534 RepID=UPI002282C274|nr:hypothetical protein [Lentilactobacillus senioris]MCY9806206.1 hypothetical protein [Lentilactobacillus senioris]
MADYDKKEDKALDKISEVLDRLDTNVSKEDADLEAGHRTRAWFEKHRAIHDVKKIMHEVGKYDRFDEDQYNKFMKDYQKAIDDFEKE